MIKTTLTKLKKAYSTLSFAPRALGLETNGKFYKLIVSLLRMADKRTKPDKTEEEACETREVISKLMLEPSDTAALFSRGFSKPEALQKTSFLAPCPPVDNKQREKSTLSNNDESKQDGLNNPVCNLQEAAASMPKTVQPSIKQPESQVNKADTTHKQETALDETKKIDPPNSLQNAIPDVVLDKNCDDSPDGKPSDAMLCCPGRENFINTGRVDVNDILNSERSAYIQSRFYDNKDDSPTIKFFASYDKTKKPPSTETDSSLDELAKHCLDSPNNKIDERLLKEMKKLGVPQTSPSSENSAIDDNIIQMDVLRKPRKPTEKTETDVETSKYEHPPVNYADEQRLEFDPSLAENEKLIDPMQKNENDTMVKQYCDVRPSIIDDNKPLLNPFDKRIIEIDDESSHDAKNGNNYYYNKATGAEQLEKTNESLKCFLVSSRNYNDETDKPSEFDKLQDNENNANSPIKPSEGIVDNVAMSCGAPPLGRTNTVDYYQSKAELDLAEQSEEKAGNVAVNSLLHQDAPSVADEPLGIHEGKVRRLKNSNGMDVQADRELVYSDQQSYITQTQMRSQIENICRDRVAKKTEPFLVSNPPEHGTIKLNIHTNQPLTTNHGESQRENEDVGPDRAVAFVQSLQSLRIRCNILPTKNTDEKATISLLVEIDAYKQPEQEFAPQHMSDAKCSKYSADHALGDLQKEADRSISYSNKMDQITRDKVTLILPVKQETTNQAQVDLSPFPEEKPEIPISEKANTEKAEILNSEKPEIPEIPISEKANTEKAEILHSEKPEIGFSEKPELPLSEKPELPLSEKPEIAFSEKPVKPLSEKPEIPLSEMLKRVRSRNRAEYCQQLEQSLGHELDKEVETITGKCGRSKRPRCPPRCPPPQKPRCPSPCRPPSNPPACPRPCGPVGPPPCPSPCPKTACPPSRCGKIAGNPCCPGAGSPRKGGNPCCPGAGSPRKGGNPCGPGGSSSPNPCKFSTHLPSMMMNSIVSLVDQGLMTGDSEVAQNQLVMATKDAYQRFLYSACFAELYRPHLLPFLNICGMEAYSGIYESMKSNLARDYDPWVPIPCWPAPKKEAKKPLVCPNKGCQIPLPGKNRPPCNPYPCQGFPKRKNSFSIIDLYACWSKPSGRQ